MWEKLFLLLSLSLKSITQPFNRRSVSDVCSMKNLGVRTSQQQKSATIIPLDKLPKYDPTAAIWFGKTKKSARPSDASALAIPAETIMVIGLWMYFDSDIC